MDRIISIMQKPWNIGTSNVISGILMATQYKQDGAYNANMWDMNKLHIKISKCVSPTKALHVIYTHSHEFRFTSDELMSTACVLLKCFGLEEGVQGPLVKSGLLQYKLKHARSKLVKATKAARSTDRKAVKAIALHVQAMNEIIRAGEELVIAKHAYDEANKLGKRRYAAARSDHQNAIKTVALHAQAMNEAILTGKAVDRAEEAHDKANKLGEKRFKRRVESYYPALAAENALIKAKKELKALEQEAKKARK